VKDRYYKNNPGARAKAQHFVEYRGWMQRWVGMMDHNKAAGFKFFDSMPKWVKDQYYQNNPQSHMGQKMTGVYGQTLTKFFNLMEKKDFAAAEHMWNTMPKWIKRTYIQHNPKSSLADGWGGHGKGKPFVAGGGGSLTDAQFKGYSASMGKWVKIMQTEGRAAGAEYFRGLPKLFQDFYLEHHPDKALLKYNDRFTTKLADYFLADSANQAQMLDDPQLLKWLHANNSELERKNAIRYLYLTLPNDAWIKRVFREKYPEVFSKEATGAQSIQSTLGKLAANPQMEQGFLDQLDKIWAGVAEAQKHQAKPSRTIVEPVHVGGPRKRSHQGRSARDVSQRDSRVVALRHPTA